VRRDHDHRGRAETLGQVEAALTAQVDVDQRHIGHEVGGLPDGVGDAHGHAHDGQPLALEQVTSGGEELGVVVDEQAAQGHASRVAGLRPVRIPANPK